MKEDDNNEQYSDANKASELNTTDLNDNLSNVYHDLSSLRQQHQQQFQQASILQTLANSSSKAAGVRKTFEQFSTTSSSSSSSSLVSAMSGTTGVNNTIVTGDDTKTMMNNNACAGTGTTMFATQQSVTSSSTSLASSTMSMNTATATKKNKTLSFLHNEDLFASNDSVASSMPGGGMSSGMQRDDKIVPASHLFRSISFQERRQQQTLQSCLKRTESGKEGKSDLTRKVSILSSKNSLQDINDRIKQQQIKMQQQLQQFASYSSSSDMSM